MSPAGCGRRPPRTSGYPELPKATESHRCTPVPPFCHIWISVSLPGGAPGVQPAQRSLHDRGPRRQRRDGGRLPGRRPGDRAADRGEAAARDGDRARAHPLRAGDRHPGGPAAPQHRAVRGARHLARRAAVPGDGVARRGRPGPAPAARAAGDAGRGRGGAAVGRGDGGGARPRGHPPRPQALQHLPHPRARHRHQAHRLRRGEAARAGRLPHRARADHRHAPLHGAGAGPRGGHRHPRRRVLAGLGALPPGHRAQRLRDRAHHRAARAPRHRGAAERLQRALRRAGGPRRGDPPRHRPPARRALRERRRARPRARPRGRPQQRSARHRPQRLGHPQGDARSLAAQQRPRAARCRRGPAPASGAWWPSYSTISATPSSRPRSRPPCATRSATTPASRRSPAGAWWRCSAWSGPRATRPSARRARRSSSPARSAARRASRPSPGPQPEAARVAVAVGHAVRGRANLAGEALDRAARQLDLAAPGTVRIDVHAAAAVEGRFVLQTDGHGGVLLREDSSGFGARQLLGRATPTVGREKEIALLLGIYNEMAEDGTPRAALVTGSAGIGKSRVRAEMMARLEATARRPEILLCRGDAMSRGSSLSALGRALRALMGVHDGEQPHEQITKVKNHVAVRLPRTLRFLAAFLGELIGVSFPDESDEPLRAARASAQLMQSRMRSALEAFVRAQPTPLVLFIEDLHWADDTTVDLVDWLLGCPDLRFAVFAFARPEVQARLPQLWERRNLTRLTLSPLSPLAAERLVAAALPQAEPAVRASVVRRAGGNALFLEELIRYAAEGREELPLTVQALVQARLDRMSPTLRQVLRAAAVFGQSFWTGGVEALLDRPAGMDLVGADGRRDHHPAERVAHRRRGRVDLPPGAGARRRLRLHPGRGPRRHAPRRGRLARVRGRRRRRPHRAARGRRGRPPARRLALRPRHAPGLHQRRPARDRARAGRSRPRLSGWGTPPRPRRGGPWRARAAPHRQGAGLLLPRPPARGGRRRRGVRAHRAPRLGPVGRVAAHRRHRPHRGRAQRRRRRPRRVGPRPRARRPVAAHPRRDHGRARPRAHRSRAPPGTRSPSRTRPSPRRRRPDRSTPRCAPSTRAPSR